MRKDGINMSKIGIILASHGNFAKGALDCLETIMGKVSDIETVTVTTSSCVEDVKSEMHDCYEKLMKTNEDVFVLTDILSGTPCNIATNLLLTEKHVTLFAGFNLPILLELCIKRQNDNLSAKDLTKHLKENFVSSLSVYDGKQERGDDNGY